jgi:YVTN family beta-propeller protein
MKKFALALTLASLLAPTSTQAQNAYVTNGASSTVSVIDTAIDAVIATIPVGLFPSIGVANPDGSKVYVILTSSNTVQVIDTARNTVSATIAVGAPTTFPRSEAVSPDASKVYVSSAPFPTPLGSPGLAIVSVIDTATNTVIATIPVGDQHTLQPGGMAVAPDGSKVYVGVDDNSSGSLSVIDTATNAVSATIPLGSSTVAGVAVAPDGSKVYAASGGAIFVIDTATNTVSATIPVIGFKLVATPDGSKVYVTNGSPSNTVSVINTATNTVSTTIPVGLLPVGVAVTPDSSKVYVGNLLSDSVSVINTATNTVSATIPVGSHPNHVSIQRAPRFAGAPGSNNCQGASVSALAIKFGVLDAAAAAFGFSTVQGLQEAIQAFCGG